MVVIRFLFGVGEAGCFPIIAKSFTTWLPRAERTRAQGLLWMAARWGGAFTPLLVVWVLRYVNWRLSFVLFGSLGVVWALLFYRWYRDNPRDHPGVNAAELELLRDVRAVRTAGHIRRAMGHGSWDRARCCCSRRSTTSSRSAGTSS